MGLEYDDDFIMIKYAASEAYKHCVINYKEEVIYYIPTHSTEEKANFMFANIGIIKEFLRVSRKKQALIYYDREQLPSRILNHQGINMSSTQTSTALQQPIILSSDSFIWAHGSFSKQLIDTMGAMVESNTPMGLVLPSPLNVREDTQVALNAACAALIKAPSMQEAVPIKSKGYWHPEDTEEYYKMRRDNSSFSLSYRTAILDGTWRRIINNYRLVGKYLACEITASEEIACPFVR